MRWRKVASRRCQLPDAALRDVSRWYGVLVKVARRLVAIERHLQDSAPKVLPRPVLAPAPVGLTAEQEARHWRERAAQQKHLMWKAGKGVRCLRCLEWRVGRRLSDFAGFPCVTLPSDRAVDAADDLQADDDLQCSPPEAEGR